MSRNWSRFQACSSLLLNSAAVCWLVPVWDINLPVCSISLQINNISNNLRRLEIITDETVLMYSRQSEGGKKSRPHQIDVKFSDTQGGESQPDPEPALSQSLKTASLGFYSRRAFVSPVHGTNVNWKYSKPNDKHHLTSSCSSHSSSRWAAEEEEEEASWALGGHAIIPSDNIFNGCCWFLRC